MSAMSSSSRMNRTRGRWAVAIALLIAWWAPLAPAQHVELKAATSGDLCLECHAPMTEVLQRAVPHEPAADGGCTECHSPHASRFANLLNKRERSLCMQCHSTEVREFQKGSIHTPVKQGECSKCHDPHASDTPGLLKKSGNALCFECHEGRHVQQEYPTVHFPFVGGECSECHQPHNSPHEFQLRLEATSLCLDCHEADDPDVMDAHAGISVVGTQCTKCHEPHASLSDGLLRSTVHEPFADGSCDMCHMVDSDTPRVVMATGSRLCSMCHDGYPRPGDDVVHAPIADGNCQACHSPHASNEEKLLTGDKRSVCIQCHQDIETRAEVSRSVHSPSLEGGSCMICHQPHSSKEDTLLWSGEIRTCLGCHETQRHGHPLGSDRIDPRTGKPITCVTCHDPHGTDFPMQLRGDQSRGLCLECHSSSGSGSTGAHGGR